MVKLTNKQEAVVFVVMLTLSAVSISCILAALTYELFYPYTFSQNMLGTIFIATTVSVPIALLLAQNNLRMAAYQDELEELASTDSLTGLHNRRRFVELLDRSLAGRQPTAVAFVDLDRFKSINDQYGHAVGDEVFKLLSERFHDDDYDWQVARLGGDEFGLLLSGDFQTIDLEIILSRLHSRLCDAVTSSAGMVSVGASIGVAVYPSHARTASGLLRAADHAMMRAKAEGGGWRFYDAGLDEHVTDAAALEEALARAIARRQIIPAYQPILHIETGRTVAMEVLARWPSSGLGVDPSPGTFIPLAERLGLIDNLFWSLLDHVMTDMADNPSDLLYALNVSPMQLQDRGFCKRLMAELDEREIDPKRIELEVTETAMFRDMATSIHTLNELAEEGVSVALDDFGTGHSSLSLVRELPLRKLKIDRSFTNSLTWSEHSVKIVAATIGLCKALDIQVCAEGVETEDTLDILREMGCDFAQGYHIGAPTPRADAEGGQVIIFRPGGMAIAG